MKGKYIIISPVRNEEKYIEETLLSVINQTHKPSEWIIVNDGSTDRTEIIIMKYVRDNNWIKLVNKKDRGFTQVGEGVMEAFHEGFKTIRIFDYEFIVKLDCDTAFVKTFFETLINRFNENNLLGIIGGTSYAFENGKLVEEKMPIFHPCAAARIYRRKCFDEIGGLKISLGWDIVDLIKAQMKGWITQRYSDLIIKHNRRMSSRSGLWEGKLRTGKNFYITGYHPLFLLARSLYRLTQKPYLIESIGVISGYINAMLKREPLIVSEEERHFVQSQQLKRLIGLRL